MYSRSIRVLFRSKRCLHIGGSLIKRQFLSPAFQCQESWKKRLESPVLKKCVLDDFYYELEAKYNQSENIAPLDVDVFVNATIDKTHLDEMQDLVHKLRLSRDACDILPSTHHGVIRVLLDCKRYDDLLTVLNDRLNYGIFPDEYSMLLLFDTFVNLKDFKNAAKIASLNMLQEDFSNALINYYSLYSCHNYLLNPDEWNKPAEPEPEDDGEEMKVRVAYLRNPYFDDHFDLTEANGLIGKTLLMVGREIGGDIGSSYQLLGSVLFNKPSQTQSCLESITNNKLKIHADVFELIQKHLIKINEEAEGSKDPDPAHNFVDADKLFKTVESSMLLSENQALPLVEKQIKQLIEESEAKIIMQQQATYLEWIETRDKILKETIENLKKEARLAEVHNVKEELERKEKELFFFDLEDQLDIEIEKKEAILKEGSGRSQVQASSSSSQDYVPPEIIKQKPSD